MNELLKDLYNELWLINLISFTVLIVSFLLFKKASGSMSLWRLNMLSFIFYVFLFLMSYIGSVLIVNELDHHYLIDKLKHPESRFYGWLAVMYAMVGLPVGMLLAKVFFTTKNARFLLKRYCQNPIVPLINKKDRYLRYGLLFLTFLCSFAVLYTLFYTEHIPLFELILGTDINTLAQQRIAAKFDFHGNEYFKNLFGIGLTPILTMIAFCYYKMTNSFTHRVWYYYLMIFTILILTYDLQKSTLIMFIVGMLMLRTLLDKELPKRKIVYTGIMMVSILLIAYSSLTEVGFQSLLKYNQGILGRVFLSGVAGLYLSFDLFPHHIDFVEWASISTHISNIFDLEHSERSARLIMEVTNPSGVKMGSAGVINALFVAEAWANFGVWGVLVSPIYVGFLIGLVYYFLLLTKKTPVFLGLFGYLSYRTSLIGGFNNYIYDVTIIVSLFVLIGAVVFAKKGYELGRRHD